MILCIFVSSLLFVTARAAIECLVIRPGFGLVAEKCPDQAIGCRIKIEKDAINWYQLGKFYDRDKLVCVMPGEYAEMNGCHKRRSGSLRCWCGDRDLCNDPETGMTLYSVFQSHGNEGVKKWLNRKTNELNDNEADDIEDVRTTTTTSTVQTTRHHHKPDRIHIRGKIYKSPIVTKKHHATTLDITSTTTTATTATTTTTTTTSTTSSTTTIFTTKSLSSYENALRQLSEEMKADDYRLKLILEDEEREAFLDNRDVSNEKKDRARQDALKRLEETARREEQLRNSVEWNEDNVLERTEEATYGFRRKHQFARHREKERRRQTEEEKMAQIERKLAENRERDQRQDDEDEDDDENAEEASPFLSENTSSLLAGAFSAVFLSVLYAF